MLRSLRLLLVTFWPTLLSRWRRGPRRPSWSFMFEWMIAFLRRDWDETAEWPLARQREGTAARPYPAPHLKKVSVRDEVIAGVPVRRFVPKTPGKTQLVFLHGGSYVYGSSKHSHGELCAHLADATSPEREGRVRRHGSVRPGDHLTRGGPLDCAWVMSPPSTLRGVR